MPASQFYHLIEIKNPKTGEEYRFQTFCQEHEIEYCGKIYENFMCVDLPFAPSSWGINTSLILAIPNISLRRASGFTRDFILEEKYLKGWLIKIVHLKKNDPNWISSQIPYVVSSGSLKSTQWEFRLENPTNITSTTGQLMKNVFSDQITKEIPRTFS